MTKPVVGGRPKKFQYNKKSVELSADILEKKCNAYFDLCEKNGEPITITGLALHLDTTKDVLMDYETKYEKEFQAVIRRAKMRCENYAEKKLYSKTPTGAIFSLKNFGWKDKSEQEVQVTGSLFGLTHKQIHADSKKTNS